MKLSLSHMLGMGGLVSMIVSLVIAFSAVKTDVALANQKITALEQMKLTVDVDHDLLIQIAAKLNLDTSKAVSLKNELK